MSPAAARHNSVLGNDPPDALPQQTPHPAHSSHCPLHIATKIRGAVQPSTILDTERCTVPLLLALRGSSRSPASFVFLEF